jgi:Reverse transcriptase (RNA-dependent DNA polymerase)
VYLLHALLHTITIVSLIFLLLLGFSLISSNLVRLPKKSNSDKKELSNYQPISHLSFLSKLAERAVKSRLTDFLTEYNLLNSFQSVYTKLHSTETALLAVHDYLIRASSQQQVSCLCLLHLSAAFDAIDHSILLERLSSWFGISGSNLIWVKSYRMSRPFRVQVRESQSSVYQLLYGVLKVLFFELSRLFRPILYTTTLRTTISKSSIHHHLYTDNTQLFISFSADKFREMFLFSKVQLLKSLHGCLQIFSCSILLKLNSYLQVFPNNFQKSTTLLSPRLILSPYHVSHLREIWVSY